MTVVRMHINDIVVHVYMINTVENVFIINHSVNLKCAFLLRWGQSYQLVKIKIRRCVMIINETIHHSSNEVDVSNYTAFNIEKTHTV